MQSIPRDCMHLDTRRCIAGQTTADGEEEEGIGRRMGRGDLEVMFCYVLRMRMGRREDG